MYFLLMVIPLITNAVLSMIYSVFPVGWFIKALRYVKLIEDRITIKQLIYLVSRRF